VFNVSTHAVRGLVGLISPAALFAVVFTYLGLAPETAVLAATVWVAQGAMGAAIIRWFIRGVTQRHAVLVVVGPGALLGIGISVSLFLLVRGGLLGIGLVTVALLIGALMWSRQAGVALPVVAPLPVVGLVVLVGCALVANSREFPNLLVAGVAVVAIGMVWAGRAEPMHRVLATALGMVGLSYELASRTSFWWWASDDTTALSAMGTMVVERGRVADLAGFPTGSYHWFLHAWLALWNKFSIGHVFETYLIAWPFVAASAALASLWLCCDLFLSRNLGVTQFAGIALVTAGLMRLEWPAPQEQQPFLFAMAACCALWLRTRQTYGRFTFWRTVAAMLMLVVAVPAWLFVLKPSLLLAYWLLITGAALVLLNVVRGWRIGLVVAVSLTTIFAGIGLMGLGAEYISQQHINSLAIDYFPNDLGWCRANSLVDSLACVVSLQVVLILSAVLAVTAMSLLGCGGNESSTKTSASPLLLMPLILAYLPLRYLVSSPAVAGASSFYRLSEMALMLVVALGVASLLASHAVRARELAVLALIDISAALVTRSPSRVHDQIDSWLVSTRPLQYLNAADVITLVFVCIAGLVVARLSLFGHWPWRFLTVIMVVVSFTPISRMAIASTSVTTPAGRLARPADFGPSDIEDIGRWLQSNTSRDALLATNYLCPTSQLDECTRSRPLFECPATQPVLVAGWALSALSKRDFLYLSQPWNTKTGYYFDHELSTRLGGEVSEDAIDELRERGVEYYIASLDHTDSRTWQQLRSAAEFGTENFIVVSLPKLIDRLTT